MILYIRGLRSFKKNQSKLADSTAFLSGVMINITALSPPIDPLSDRLFFMHMIQHMAIILLGSPLMIMGAPFYVIIRSLKPWTRRNIYFPLAKNLVVRNINKVLSHAVVALVLFNVNFWFWHMPKWYNLAFLMTFFTC